MEEMITIPFSEYEQLKHENAELCSLVQQLEKVVEDLRAEISLLKGGKNSRSSSTSPSHDLGRSNKQSFRQSSGNKSGGQPGHIGRHLPLSDTPTEIIPHYPHKCAHCGNGLQDTESRLISRRQIVDIPSVFLTYTEHQIHEKICPSCGMKNCGKFPADVVAPIQYGSSIEAMVGYLSVFQSLPYKRICNLFKVFFGLNISQGSVDNFLENLTQKSKAIYKNIQSKIQESQFVGADETGCRVNGKKYWFHVWQNQLYTFIVAFSSRGHKVIKQYFMDGFKFAVYVSDCWSSQLKVNAKAHQLCIVHLLRELNNFIDNLNSQWSFKMKNLFQRAIELKNKMTENDYQNPPAELAELNAELDELLKIDYTQFHKKEQAFVKRLNKHKQSIFTFLSYPEVPYDNNASERAIRNVKVKTKVSGQFRNADGKGADRYAKIRSVVDTAIKNGEEVYSALIKIAKSTMEMLPE
jgi:transposase